MENTFMKGKRGVVMGAANDRSLAWGIAEMAMKSGAEVCFTYRDENIEKRLRPLAEAAGADFFLQCDATNDESMDACFKEIEEKWGKIDFLVHSMAFSKKAELEGPYLNTTRKNYLLSLDTSAYSFTAVAQRAVPLMTDGGSLITMSYYGAETVIPNYNVMGVAKAALECSVRYLAADLGKDNIRVNAISAGPIKTMAASGIGDFNYLLNWNAANAPLRRNITLDDVAKAGLFLLSDLGSGVTGEIMYVDSGYNAVGMPALDCLDSSIEVLQKAKKGAGE